MTRLATVKTVRLAFESRLAAPAADCWAHATSVAGIAAEMRPLLKMTIPGGKASILDFDLVPGRPLFRSWMLLFGVLPVDRSDLTLVELEDGRRFLEQSPMLGMKLWRHERIVTAIPGGTAVIDRLEFAPRLASGLVRWFVRLLFARRHAVLRRKFGRLPS
ncbi:MAG TPA: hypothetical protein VEC06_02250 [Paucimonas sp.]|nr:hypothetical protein [Paucimonas sp.]